MPVPPSLFKTRALRRLAVVQMPTLDAAAEVLVGLTHLRRGQ